mmetsp:Transcript_37184/g.115725  ORF Transcript_37184/g.115725 Transcript_37184/m.115725 type:complete len:405 (-) Transcript_37184:14-1228(-)
MGRLRRRLRRSCGLSAAASLPQIMSNSSPALTHASAACEKELATTILPPVSSTGLKQRPTVEGLRHSMSNSTPRRTKPGPSSNSPVPAFSTAAVPRTVEAITRTGSGDSGCAPARSSASTTSTWPALAARPRAVWPKALLDSGGKSAAVPARGAASRSTLEPSDGPNARLRSRASSQGPSAPFTARSSSPTHAPCSWASEPGNTRATNGRPDETSNARPPPGPGSERETSRKSPPFARLGCRMGHEHPFRWATAKPRLNVTPPASTRPPLPCPAPRASACLPFRVVHAPSLYCSHLPELCPGPAHVALSPRHSSTTLAAPTPAARCSKELPLESSCAKDQSSRDPALCSRASALAGSPCRRALLTSWTLTMAGAGPGTRAWASCGAAERRMRREGRRRGARQLF